MQTPTITTEPNETHANDEQSTTAKRVTVIFNPVSGVEDPEVRKQKITESLQQFDYECDFALTTEQESGTVLAEKALGSGAELILVSGGDGTVMQVLTAVVGKNVPVAVIPSGTGNLLSINLGIPLTIPEAVHTALNGKPYSLDLAKTSDGRHFAIMGGLGLDANMIADADRSLKKRLGVVAYFVAAAKNWRKPPLEVQVSVDGKEPMKRFVSSVLIANMGKITGGVEAVPEASPTSGNLEVAIVKSANFGQWVRLLWYAFLGRTSDDPGYEHYKATTVDISTKTPQHSQLDGEDAGKISHLHVKVLPQAVKILLPEQESESRAIRAQPEVTARHDGDRRVLILSALLLSLAAGLLWLREKRQKDQK